MSVSKVSNSNKLAVRNAYSYAPATERKVSAMRLVHLEDLIIDGVSPIVTGKIFISQHIPCVDCFILDLFVSSLQKLAHLVKFNPGIARV